MYFKKLFVVFVLTIFVFSSLLAVQRPELKFRLVKVKKGDTYYKLFGDKWTIIRTINKIDEYHLEIGAELKVPLDWELAKEYPFFPKFLEQEKKVPKLILVAIEEQFLAGYEFGELKFWHSICSGMEKGLTADWILKRQAEIEKWQKEKIEKERISELTKDKKEALTVLEKILKEWPEIIEHPTPRGRFKVLYKRADHRSSIYPRPDGGQFMPWTVMFSWKGYGFHAWGFPNDLKKSIKKLIEIYFGALAPMIIREFEKYALGRMPGWPASHGCIRLFYEDANNLFEWVEVKKTIVLIIDSFDDFPPAADQPKAEKK